MSTTGAQQSDAVRRLVLGLWNTARAARGYVSFRRTGRQDPTALMGLRGMFTADPRLPRAAARVVGLATRPRPSIEPAVGLLGTLDRRTQRAMADQLEQDGYIIFDAKLSPARIAALSDEIAALPSYAALNVGTRQTGVRFDRDDLQASRYDYDEVDLITCPNVQALMVDPTFAAVADIYLDRDSVQTVVSAWRSLPFDEAPSSAAAQLFHSDRDHLRFLKFFVYLTDVSTSSGPHVFVRTSHRRRPPSLRRDVRFEDREVLVAYAPEDVLELCGSAGTIMAVDTSGLHKGKPPGVGERLILQFEFGSSRYGAPGPILSVVPASDDIAKRLGADRRKFARLVAEPLQQPG